MREMAVLWVFVVHQWCLIPWIARCRRHCEQIYREAIQPCQQNWFCMDCFADETSLAMTTNLVRRDDWRSVIAQQAQ